MISAYLSLGERKGGMRGESETVRAGRHIHSWLVLSHPAAGELRGKSSTPYFADCPSDKMKSLEVQGDVLSRPRANHRADSRRKSGGIDIHTC